MPSPPRRSSLRRAEGRLWTGPTAHLLAGAADVLEALTRHLGGRVLRRARDGVVGLPARLTRAGRGRDGAKRR